MNSKHIVILFHENASPDGLINYSIPQLAQTWRADGHKVTIIFGPDQYVPGDLLFMHVDISVVPESYLALAEHYPAAINRKVGDIRKSAISRNLVDRNSDWAGPVIVKTDLNCFGTPEKRLLLGRQTIADYNNANAVPLPLHTFLNYPIYPKLSAVPEELFDDPGLVVEKFLPERHDGHFHIRTYHFLGDHESSWLHVSKDPMVKARTLVRRQPIEADPVIREMRKKLSIDYGKLDYVIHDGKHVLIDVNKTTGGGRLSENPRIVKSRSERARALYAFFKDA